MADNLSQRLKARAKSWASSITKLANKNLGKYKSLILVKSETEDRGGLIGIKTTASPSNKNKPVARAYEYGSGTRSRLAKRSKWQQGTRGKILITPKRKKVLAFFWDKLDVPPNTVFNGKKLIKTNAEGKALFRFVEHPGVQAANGGKGYLAPAIKEVRKQVRKEIPIDVREAALGIFRKKFIK
jgi:hypothetical protein